MRKSLFLAASLCGAAPVPCAAAMLKPFIQITSATVHLADLFDDLGTTPDRALGAAPAPGARIIVASPQLAAIARDYNVAWRPETGNERAVLERRGDVLQRSAVMAVLKASLAEAGAPQEADIASPDIQPIVVPAGSTVMPEVSQLNYDAQSGRFTALLSVSLQGEGETQMRVSGQVVAMARTVIASHRLSPGSVITASDIQPARVRLASLHGGAPVAAEAVAGLTVKHDVAAGQPLAASDVMRPPLVTRGMVVRMSLAADGIALTAQGIAAEAGADGDRIHVENPLSHRLVEAQVTGPGEVVVAPRGAAITLAAAQ